MKLRQARKCLRKMAHTTERHRVPTQVRAWRRYDRWRARRPLVTKADVRAARKGTWSNLLSRAS